MNSTVKQLYYNPDRNISVVEEDVIDNDAFIYYRKNTEVKFEDTPDERIVLSSKNADISAMICFGGIGKTNIMRLSMEQGKTYTATIKVSIKQELTGRQHPNGLRLHFDYVDKEDNLCWWEEKSAPAPNLVGEWEISMTFTVPEGAKGAWVSFSPGMTANNGKVTVYDIRITETDRMIAPFFENIKAPYEDMIENGECTRTYVKNDKLSADQFILYLQYAKSHRYYYDLQEIKKLLVSKKDEFLYDLFVENRVSCTVDEICEYLTGCSEEVINKVFVKLEVLNTPEAIQCIRIMLGKFSDSEYAKIVNESAYLNCEPKEKVNAIMFISNKAMKFALGAMLINIKEVMPDFEHDVVVYYDGFDAKDIMDIKRIRSDVHFIEYTLEQWESEHKKVMSKKANWFVSRYTHLAYSKYKVFSVAKSYSKVLFLDLDMLIKGEISDLFKIEGMAWKNGIPFYKVFTNHVSLDNAPEIRDNIPTDYPKPNGGLLYASLQKEQAEACLERGREFIVNYMDHIIGGCDELAVAYATGMNDINITPLGNVVYNVFPQYYGYGSKIMHFMGSDKVWNDDLYQLIFPKWFEYYEKAVQISDVASAKAVKCKDMGSVIMKYKHQERWLAFLRETNLQVPKELKINYNFNTHFMKFDYTDKIKYEIKFIEKFAGTHDYYVGVTISDAYIIERTSFIEALEAFKEKRNYAITIEKKEKSVYVYTSVIKRHLVSERLSEFSKNTISIIEQFKK